MKKEVIKLKEGNSVIYQDKTLMEKANVVSIDKKNGTAILSNKVIITRTTNLEGQFTRLDGKGNAIILPCRTEVQFLCCISPIQEILRGNQKMVG